MTWEKNPGGKRYTARTAAGTFRLVRQNTAAGALPWRATVERDGVTRRVADTRYLGEAKAACVAAEGESDDHAHAAAMSLTFAGEAYEWFQMAVEQLCEMTPSTLVFVQVTPAEEGEAFDAWLLGVDRDAEMGDTVRVVRNNDAGSTGPELGIVESVRADRIHVY